MKTAQILLVALLLAAFCGCSGISVRTDFDEKADFTVYKTYDWIKFREESQSGLMNDPLLRKGIMDAVEEELAAKGYAPAAGRARFLRGLSHRLQEEDRRRPLLLHLRLAGAVKRPRRERSKIQGRDTDNRHRRRFREGTGLARIRDERASRPGRGRR